MTKESVNYAFYCRHDVSYLISSGLLVMFAFIDVTLFLLLAVGIKFKLIQFTRSHTKDIFCKGIWN